MANQGFVKTLNLSEVIDGVDIIQNLAGGTVDKDMRLFAGLSSEKSQLIWNRFLYTAENNQSVASLRKGTQFCWDTNYTYTDDDYIFIEPINILKDFEATYVGFSPKDEFGNAIFITDPLGSADFNFDIGEGYNEGQFDDIPLSGSELGNGAKASIIVSAQGTVSAVKISDVGNNYSFGDKLMLGEDKGQGNGVGFVIRITAFPWKATAVGNHAWDIEDLDTLDLRITYDNCSSSLDGTYVIQKADTGKNIWGIPNQPGVLSYDINRKISAQEKINNNFDIYDIDGDGSITVHDKDYIEMFIDGDDELAFTTAINNDPNKPQPGSVRQTGAAIYRYISGLAPSVLDIDGNGVADQTDVDMIDNYVIGGGSIYTRGSASTIDNSRQAYSVSLKHAISVTCRIPFSPGSVSNFGASGTPHFYIEKYQNNEWKNIYDNFDKYGTTQTCSTNEDDYIDASIGQTKTEGNIDYTIIDKFSTSDGVTNNYFITIVANGTGFTNNQTFGTDPELTASTGVPVFNKSSEYGVFDSDGKGKFYLRTNPRSTIESVKQMVLFSDTYNLTTSESTLYTGGTNSKVPTTTLIPDLLLKRDDSLTVSNIENLEPPVIIDTENSAYSAGRGSFSYNVDGYSETLEAVTDNVDESIYLRSTKFRIDRNLYYKKEIKFKGFITSYDPDELNLTQTDLTNELSPGIYISSSLSQVTNPLASDYANKTRSFSSDFNPWSAFPSATPGKLATESLNVTINDLVWTTEIEFDIGTSTANGTRFTSISDLNETLGQNFQITDAANPTSFKLKININGEVFYLMMSKP